MSGSYSEGDSIIPILFSSVAPAPSGRPAKKRYFCAHNTLLLQQSTVPHCAYMYMYIYRCICTKSKYVGSTYLCIVFDHSGMQYMCVVGLSPAHTKWLLGHAADDRE